MHHVNHTSFYAVFSSTLVFTGLHRMNHVNHIFLKFKVPTNSTDKFNQYLVNHIIFKFNMVTMVHAVGVSKFNTSRKPHGLFIWYISGYSQLIVDFIAQEKSSLASNKGGIIFFRGLPRGLGAFLIPLHSLLSSFII